MNQFEREKINEDYLCQIVDTRTYGEAPPLTETPAGCDEVVSRRTALEEVARFIAEQVVFPHAVAAYAQGFEEGVRAGREDALNEAQARIGQIASENIAYLHEHLALFIWQFCQDMGLTDEIEDPIRLEDCQKWVRERSQRK